ncbi:hypothetical protein BH10PSE9_BH10PSE9_04850 [soil metagenome]
MPDGEADLNAAEALIATNRVEIDAVEEKDRSGIAQRVVWLYVAVTVACFLFVFIFFWFFPGCRPDGANCAAWKEPAEFLLKVLTSVVLPIVTLVLGYYFGTAKAKG